MCSCYKCGGEWNKAKQLCSTGQCDLWDEDKLVKARQDGLLPQQNRVRNVALGGVRAIQERFNEINARNVAYQAPQQQQQRNIYERRIHRRLDADEIEFHMTHFGRLNRPKDAPDWYEHMMQTGICFHCHLKYRDIWDHLNTTDHDVFHCCNRLFRTQNTLDSHRRDSTICPYRDPGIKSYF